ncbi:MAG: cytochrome c biogenesis CcdA family protein [Longimicrobiales bacterium]|nr:cytochrome c biogenesis CcdA family protein [Longimicrobiales bacterium]
MTQELGILIAVTAGILSFLSPCVLPLVPSYLSFVTGMTLEELEEPTDRRSILIHAGLFVAGFTTIFVMLGASASFLGAFFLTYRDWVARIGGLVLLVLGLHLLGVFRIMPLMREKRVQLSDKPAGHIGTFAVGAAFGAGWTPCIGPVLAGILTLAGTSDTIWSGMGLLLAYSAGLAIPFILAALALDKFLHSMKRIRPWIPWIERASGLLLVLLGVLLVSGQFTILAQYLGGLTPEWLQERI